MKIGKENQLTTVLNDAECCAIVCKILSDKMSRTYAVIIILENSHSTGNPGKERCANQGKHTHPYACHIRKSAHRVYNGLPH